MQTREHEDVRHVISCILYCDQLNSLWQVVIEQVSYDANAQCMIATEYLYTKHKVLV